MGNIGSLHEIGPLGTLCQLCTPLRDLWKSLNSYEYFDYHMPISFYGYTFIILTYRSYKTCQNQHDCDRIRFSALDALLYQKIDNSINTLRANPTKWSNTLKQFVRNLPTNYLSVFDYFVRLALKELKLIEKNRLLVIYVINTMMIKAINWLIESRSDFHLKIFVITLMNRFLPWLIWATYNAFPKISENKR